MLNGFTVVISLVILIVIVRTIYKALADECKHDWVFGRGWITVGEGVQVHYEGDRCTKCHKCKDAPDIVEYHEHSA